jgi:hypothetical protein
LPKEPQNAALHLFSASPELVEFGRATYHLRSSDTSMVLSEVFDLEGVGMSYTMEDFRRDYFKKHFSKLTAQERRQVLASLPPEEQEGALQELPLERRLAGVSAQQLRQYLDQMAAGQTAKSRKARRKK